MFYGARLLHLPLSVAWALQGVVSVATVAALVWVYWKRRDPALSLAYFVTATFLVTPYILNYDMVVLGFVVALLRGRADNTPRDHQLLIAVWTLPVTMMFAALVFVPLGPIVLGWFGYRLLQRLKQSEARKAEALPERAAPVAA